MGLLDIDLFHLMECLQKISDDFRNNITNCYVPDRVLDATMKSKCLPQNKDLLVKYGIKLHHLNLFLKKRIKKRSIIDIYATRRPYECDNRTQNAYLTGIIDCMKSYQIEIDSYPKERTSIQPSIANFFQMNPNICTKKI